MQYQQLKLELKKKVYLCTDLVLCKGRELAISKANVLYIHKYGQALNAVIKMLIQIEVIITVLSKMQILRKMGNLGQKFSYFLSSLPTGMVIFA